MRRILFLLLALVALAAPAAALDMRFSPAPGNVPGALQDDTLGINRADGRLFWRRTNGQLGAATLLNALPSGRRAVEQGQADDLTVGGQSIPAALGNKAPLANPVFSGKVKSDSLEGDASTSSIKPWSIDNLTRLIQLADWAKRVRAAEDFITLQVGIDQLSKEGGGILRVPFRYQPTSPIIMRKGVCLEGQSSPIGDDTDAPSCGSRSSSPPPTWRRSSRKTA